MISISTAQGGKMYQLILSFLFQSFLASAGTVCDKLNEDWNWQHNEPERRRIISFTSNSDCSVLNMKFLALYRGSIPFHTSYVFQIDPNFKFVEEWADPTDGSMRSKFIRSILVENGVVMETKIVVTDTNEAVLLSSLTYQAFDEGKMIVTYRGYFPREGKKFENKELYLK